MRSIRYGEYAHHKQIHDHFRDETLVSLKKELEQSEYSPAAIQHLTDTMQNWLAGHIMKEDQKNKKPDRDEEEEKWKNRSFGWLELGILYSPMITPAAASRRLKAWVLANKILVTLLKAAGWNRKQRVMTPKQVECIVEILGRP